MYGYDPSALSNLHLYRFDFGSTSPTWALKMACPFGSWTIDISESLLVSSSIYSFIIYGSTQYLYLFVITAADGSVTARSKSSIVCSSAALGTAFNDEYVLASIVCPSSINLFVINKSDNSLTIKAFSGNTLYGIALEASTGR